MLFQLLKIIIKILKRTVLHRFPNNTMCSVHGFICVNGKLVLTVIMLYEGHSKSNINYTLLTRKCILINAFIQLHIIIHTFPHNPHHIQFIGANTSPVLAYSKKRIFWLIHSHVCTANLTSLSYLNLIPPSFSLRGPKHRNHSV